MDGAKIEYSKGLDRPLFTVSLHDAFGNRLEAAQDSPPGHFHRPTRTISAGHELQFRTPMQQIPAGEQQHAAALCIIRAERLPRAVCPAQPDPL